MATATKQAPAANNSPATKPSSKGGKKLVLPPALGSYANIFQPREIEGSSGGPKYSISLLWDANDKSLAPVRKLIEEVAVAKFGPAAKQWLAQGGGRFHNPLRDGSIEKPEDAVYAGKVFLNASSSRQPGIVDGKLNKVFEEEEAYSGCTFRASVSFFAFDKAGKKGVGCGLNNLQVVKKGDRIDGRRDAAEEFADFVDEGEAAPAADVDPIG